MASRIRTKRTSGSLVRTLVSNVPVVGPLVNALVPHKANKQTTLVVRQGRTGGRQRGRQRKRRTGVPPQSTYTGKGPSPATMGKVWTSPIPVSVTGGACTLSWKFGKGVQKLTDFDSEKAIRVEGSCRMNVGIGAATGTGTGLYNGSLVGYYIGFNPNSFDVRLHTLATAFSFFAFRAIRIRYVPFICAQPGGTDLGTLANAAFAIGVLESPHEASDVTGPSSAQIMDLNPSMLTSAISPAEIMYNHTGSRVWQCTPAASDTSEYIQAYLAGAWDSSITQTTGRGCGALFADYVCDLYCPSFIDTSDDAPKQKCVPIVHSKAFPSVKGNCDSKDEKDCKSTLNNSYFPNVVSSAATAAGEPSLSDAPVVRSLLSTQLLALKRQEMEKDLASLNRRAASQPPDDRKTK